MRDVHVAGVATTKFGQHRGRTLGSLATEAIELALIDAQLLVCQVEAAVFSNAAEGVLSGQEMIRGQVSLKGTGLEGIPIVNTENACASGGSALHLAWLMVASGQHDVVIAVGAEKLIHADKQRSFAAIESGTDRSLTPDGNVAGSVMMGAYAAEAREYSERFGDVTPALAAVAVKNREGARLNPAAQFQTAVTADDVLESRLVAPPLRLLMCSPLTDGAAAVVLSAVPTGGVRMAHSSLVSHDSSEEPVVVRAARGAYEAGGIGPVDVDLFQLHDACAFAEILQYEQIGLAEHGKGAEFALAGRSGLGGSAPVNTDGGLLSRGHALGATGLAQVAEMTVQLRGTAGARQVDGARTALAVNAGGWMGNDYAAAVATLLVRA
jgi:acetyl-CoA acetyltransferase